METVRYIYTLLLSPPTTEMIELYSGAKINIPVDISAPNNRFTVAYLCHYDNIVTGQVPGYKQLVNYYRGSEVICRKCSFVRELKRYCLQEGRDQFPWFPQSYTILPRKHHPHYNLQLDISNDEVPEKDERSDLLKHDQSTENASRRVWIAKSSSGSKGDGIMLSHNVEDLINEIDNQPQAYIIQQYIINPFLLTYHRKFDIRCWVLLDGDCNIYLYKEGVLRTASETYNIDNITDVASHLTNHSLQKEKSTQFGLYEEGNEMFYKQFNEYLLKCKGESLDVSVLPQIKDIINTCFTIIRESLDTSTLDYTSFQLFGFDFLLDDNLKIWLLEINGAPACAQKLLPELIESLVVTAIDPVFPQITSTTAQTKASYFEKVS